MICCREFVKAVKKGVFEFGLDANGDAKLEIRTLYGPTMIPVVRHAFNMNYCPFCGSKLEMGYKTPQVPYEPDVDEVFHQSKFVKAEDVNHTVAQDPNSEVHLE